MFQINKRLKPFEIFNSSIRNVWILLNKTFFRPVILMPFMEPSIAVVAEIRLSIASSQRAWRDITKFKARIEATKETICV